MKRTKTPVEPGVFNIAGVNYSIQCDGEIKKGVPTSPAENAVMTQIGAEGLYSPP